jgi:hypothetical protein
VKVMAKMLVGSIPLEIIQATRWVKHLVLPDPGPLITKTGPSIVLTASCCLSFRPFRMGLVVGIWVIVSRNQLADLSVDLGRIELPTQQCECCIIPLYDRPIFSCLSGRRELNSVFTNPNRAYDRHTPARSIFRRNIF